LWFFLPFHRIDSDPALALTGRLGVPKPPSRRTQAFSISLLFSNPSFGGS
jgi:hypothetical protein